jgi:prepilin-type N-terminal cleavage/methylation domain-containing protein
MPVSRADEKVDGRRALEYHESMAVFSSIWRAPAPARTLPRSRAFTLIELLVVITIIAILIGLLFPAFRGVQDQAKRTQAKNDLTQIVTAVSAYYTEYGKYPLVTADAIIKNTSTPGNFDLMYTLRAVSGGLNAGNVANTRQIVFINPPDAKDQTTPRNGIKTSDGQWYDPWGTPYLIEIDGGYDNQIPNPYSANAGATPNLQIGVIAWSLGSDAAGATAAAAGDKKTGVYDDDVISWQ